MENQVEKEPKTKQVNTRFEASKYAKLAVVATIFETNPTDLVYTWASERLEDLIKEHPELIEAFEATAIAKEAIENE